MKKYYICRNFNDSCGISRYGSSFYKSVLLIRKYDAVHLVDKNDVINKVKMIDNNDSVWIEIGLGSRLEVELLKRLVRKGNKNITITVHDSPFLEYPIYNFNNYIVNIILKLVQIIFLRKPISNFFYNYLNKAKYVFTLNVKGMKLLEKRYGLKNVYAIPHILDNILLPSNKDYNETQILYFGFIGKNKGLEYALQLHELINETSKVPIQMKVIGKVVDSTSLSYLNSLKERYVSNVIYLGYVQDNELEEIMRKDNIVFLPTKDYRFICPTSGSVLNSMQFLNIVFTNNVNSNKFIVKDGFNGFFLTGDILIDKENVKKVLNDIEYRKLISRNIYFDLMEKYSYSAVEAEIIKYEL